MKHKSEIFYYFKHCIAKVHNIFHTTIMVLESDIYIKFEIYFIQLLWSSKVTSTYAHTFCYSFHGYSCLCFRLKETLIFCRCFK